MEQGDGAEIRKFCPVATDAACGAKWCDLPGRGDIESYCYPTAEPVEYTKGNSG